MKESILFPCYSIPLRDYLSEHGIKYELVGLNPNTNKMFWVYIKTPELLKYLIKWSDK